MAEILSWIVLGVGGLTLLAFEAWLIYDAGYRQGKMDGQEADRG